MALARLKYLKSAALLNESSTEFDEVLKRLLAAETGFACKYTMRALEGATYTAEEYTGDGSNDLWPRQYPVTAIGSVKLWDGNAWATLDATHYSVVDGRPIFYPIRTKEADAEYSHWPEPDCGKPNIQLTYTAGYDTTNWAAAAITDAFAVPAELEHAVATLAALRWMDSRADQGRLGIASMSKSVETIQVEKYERGVPLDVKLVLDEYRRRI